MSGRQRIPQGLPNWQELNRRSAMLSDQSLNLLEEVVPNTFVFAAYGSVTSTFYNTNIPTSSYIDLRVDTAAVAAPRHVAYDFPRNAIQYNVQGIYVVNLFLSLEVVESNHGRNFSVRPFNIDTATPGNTSLIAVGRNQSGVNVSITRLVEISSALVGDFFRWEIGNANVAFNNTDFENVEFSTWNVGEYRDEL